MNKKTCSDEMDIKCIIEYCNKLLEIRGHLFIDELYNKLNIPFPRRYQPAPIYLILDHGKYYGILPSEEEL